MHIHKIFYIKTFKIAPTCFDPKIIFAAENVPDYGGVSCVMPCEHDTHP